MTQTRSIMASADAAAAAARQTGAAVLASDARVRYFKLVAVLIAYVGQAGRLAKR